MIENRASWTNLTAQRTLRKSLQNNDVSIVSTDTILGFIAPITLEGFTKLMHIKGKREQKPYLILIASHKKLSSFIDETKLSNAMLNVLHHCWPGPLTVIFQARTPQPTYLTSSTGTIALRCPQHKELRILLEDFDGLFSTSANKSGEAVPQSYYDVPQDIIQKIAYVVLDENNEKNPQQNLPSTIIDFSAAMENHAAPVRVIREGAYSIKELESYYGKSFTR